MKMFEFITRVKENKELLQKNFDLRCENRTLRSNHLKDTHLILSASSKIDGLNRDLARYDQIIFDYSEKHPFGDESYFNRKEDK